MSTPPPQSVTSPASQRVDENAGWAEYTLEEVYSFASGLSKGREDFGYGYPFVSFKDVFANFFLPMKLGGRANTTDRERTACSVKRGDVFLTRTSETQEELGLSSVALVDYPEATFNGFTKRLRPRGTVEILPEYSGFFFRSPGFRATVTSMSSITTRASLNNDMLRVLRIAVPPPPEQKAIASVLTGLNDKIDLLHRQNQTLEAMAKTLFREWFVEGADEYWETCKVGDLMTVKGGTTPSTKEASFWDGAVPWTSPRDLSNQRSIHLFDTNRKITPLGLAEIGSGLLPKGTVLLSSRAPIGYLAITDLPVAINQGYIAMICDDGIPNYYAYLWCKQHMDTIKAAGNGSTFEEISKSSFKALPFLVPPAEKLEAFDGVVRSMFGKLRANELQVRSLENLRDTLLPKLMSGEVRVGC